MLDMNAKTYDAQVSNIMQKQGDIDYKDSTNSNSLSNRRNKRKHNTHIRPGISAKKLLNESAALNYLITGNSEALMIKRNNLNVARRDFVEMILKFSAAIRNYSKKSKNEVLLKEVSFSYSYLHRLPHVELAIKGRMILYYSQVHISKLHFYFISDDDLLEFESKLKSYSTAINEKLRCLNNKYV